MARKTNRLTAMEVAKLEKPGCCCDGAGLYLQVSKSRSKSWIMRYTLAAAAFIEANSPAWRNAKQGDQWRNTLATYASPVIGELPVSKIETAHVLRILSPIWTIKTETATRVRGRIEEILDWAKVQGYRASENPAV